MVRSLGLAFGFVLLFLLIGPSRELLFPTGPRAQVVKTVQTDGAVAAARATAAYQVVVPHGLPAGWRPTSVRVDTGTSAGGSSASLHLGYVTPSERYVALEQGDAADFVASVLGEGVRPLPAVDIAGQPWQQSRTRVGELALSRTTDGRSVVVTGSAGLAELRALAASLGAG